MNKAIAKLEDQIDRSARFKTVIALIIDGTISTFEGIVNGQIIKERRGEGGFGYDPIFMPDGYEQTFGELPASEKNKISHRAIATKKLIDYLSANSL